MKTKWNEVLDQYAISREEFTHLFFGKEWLVLDDKLWDNGWYGFTDSFHYFLNEDEYYILHMQSGTLINWYKHLGRTNTCNKTLTLEEYKEFIELFKEELEC